MQTQLERLVSVSHLHLLLYIPSHVELVLCELETLEGPKGDEQDTSIVGATAKLLRKH